jgi:hypothetical protein
MTTKRIYSSLMIRLYIMICLFIFAVSSVRSQDSLTVISHAKGAPDQMKMSELVSVFMGEKERWSDGTKITLVLMKTTTPIGMETSKKVYSRSGNSVLQYWNLQSFAGKAQLPTMFNSTAELEAFVAQNPGAIGIIDKPSSIPETKTVMVNGKKYF